MRHGITDEEDTVDRMPVPVLDVVTDTDERTWLVDCLEFQAVGTTVMSDWQQREFTGAELVVIGGALVLRDLAGELVEARGPGTWGSVVRKTGGTS